MATHEQIQATVLAAVQEANRQLPPGSQLDATVETVLFGRDGKLDSLGLVNLILEVERGLEEELGVSIVLADEKAFSQKSSPFRTVQALIDYIVELLDEESHA